MDLRPGAIDPKIRQVSLERFRRLFEIAASFRPRSIVLHPSYDEKYYVSSGSKWLENSIDTWTQLIPLAEGLDTRIALENVYEADAGYLGHLLDALPPRARRILLRHGALQCLSPRPRSRRGSTGSGHGSSRSISMTTRARLTSICLWGRGPFPSRGFSPSCAKGRFRPILTVEAHSETNLAKTLANIKALGILEGLADARGTEGQPTRPGMEASVPGRS